MLISANTFFQVMAHADISGYIFSLWLMLISEYIFFQVMAHADISG